MSLGREITEADVGISEISAVEAYLEFHDEFTKQMSAITRKKNADYAGAKGDSDPFANFRNVESLGICTTIQGFLTRMTDKMSRLATFSQKGVLEVKDETVTDTLLDLANYSALLAAYLDSERKK